MRNHLQGQQILVFIRILYFALFLVYQKIGRISFLYLLIFRTFQNLKHYQVLVDNINYDFKFNLIEIINIGSSKKSTAVSLIFWPDFLKTTDIKQSIQFYSKTSSIQFERSKY